ncbi:MAG: hypothetical protein RLN88_11480 [Ekhidna sp.]|uniref:hypothetical protein n=1 Tax=Ekhidna sp. TaxID=2608089 RepID=UPI0032EB6615
MWYYQSKRDDSQLIIELNKLADKLPTWGLNEYVGRLKQMGFSWGGHAFGGCIWKWG